MARCRRKSNLIQQLKALLASNSGIYWRVCIAVGQILDSNNVLIISYGDLLICMAKFECWILNMTLYLFWYFFNCSKLRKRGQTQQLWLGILAIGIPEVSWVRLLLEGMSGFPSPFEGLRTILWDWSHFSVGLYDMKYNPTEKQLVI